MVSPVTPHFEKQTYHELLSLLSNAGFPDTGFNSVVIAITRVLGTEPKTQEYEYSEPYPQLPWIKVNSNKIDDKHVSIDLHARYSIPKNGEIHFKGCYYQSGLSEWTAKECSLI